jgi:hypothetical protein
LRSRLVGARQEEGGPAEDGQRRERVERLLEQGVAVEAAGEPTDRMEVGVGDDGDGLVAACVQGLGARSDGGDPDVPVAERGGGSEAQANLQRVGE